MPIIAIFINQPSKSAVGVRSAALIVNKTAIIARKGLARAFGLQGMKSDLGPALAKSIGHLPRHPPYAPKTTTTKPLLAATLLAFQKLTVNCVAVRPETVAKRAAVVVSNGVTKTP